MTELVFILDRSGSMHGLERDTIGGFNGMLERQRQEAAEALVTTVLFDSTATTLHDRLPLSTVPPMTEADYTTRGTTALFDALGDAICHIGTIHKYARREDLPERTLFVITTDGYENASRRHSEQAVRRMVEERKAAGWEFLFLGANIDAAAEAARFGIGEDCAANYCSDSAGTALGYEAIGEAVRCACSDQPLPTGWKHRVEEDRRRRGR